MYFYFFLSSLTASIIFTLLIKKISIRLNILDRPNLERKIHSKPTPLLGGLAIFLAFFLILFLAKNELISGNLKYSHWIGFFAGGLVLMVGGFLDDKYSLKPSRQIIFPILAITLVILGGVGIEKITNPFSNNFFYFNALTSGIFIFLWLFGMMYTTKILDGLDGLVTGVVMIGAIIIALFTFSAKYYQPDIAFASLVLAGTCLGFLIFNWHPAKIFLGEGGSLFLGYALGVLAIISGGKVAIALLVMGIPIMDLAWTIIRRINSGQNPFRFADQKHLHFRFLSLGFSVRQTVLIFYSFSTFFGILVLFFQTRGKALALALLCVIMFLLVISFNFLDKKYDRSNSNRGKTI